MLIQARSIIDFSAAYDVFDGAGTRLGTWKRKGWKPLMRDTWIVEDAQGCEVATLEEDSLFI